MLRNYLTIAWRILWHNKVFSIINIFGLAVGMAAALILFQYVRFEKSYDNFHEKGDRIYRPYYHVINSTNEMYKDLKEIDKKEIIVLKISNKEADEMKLLQIHLKNDKGHCYNKAGNTRIK